MCWSLLSRPTVEQDKMFCTASHGNLRIVIPAMLHRHVKQLDYVRNTVIQAFVQGKGLNVYMLSYIRLLSFRSSHSICVRKATCFSSSLWQQANHRDRKRAKMTRTTHWQCRCHTADYGLQTEIQTWSYRPCQPALYRTDHRDSRRHVWAECHRSPAGAGHCGKVPARARHHHSEAGWDPSNAWYSGW